MSDGRYRKSDKSYGYPQEVVCRFAHKNRHGDYFCHMWSFDEYGNRLFKKSLICLYPRVTNLRNGYACENYRGHRQAHMVCDKCNFDMHCIENYRIHNDGVSVFKCENCKHTEEYT